MFDRWNETKGIPAEIQALFLPTVMIDLNQECMNTNQRVLI